MFEMLKLFFFSISFAQSKHLKRQFFPARENNNWVEIRLRTPKPINNAIVLKFTTPFWNVNKFLHQKTVI